MSSSSGITSPVQAAIQGSKGNVAQIVQIIKLPEGLENSAKALRLEGEITSRNQKDGTVRIETEKGTIDVKIKGNRQPQVGQKIEIEIPAGKQPRQATIRTTPTPQNVNHHQQAPSAQAQAQTQAPQNTTTTNSRITTPVPQDTSQNIRQRTTQPLPPAVQENASVRNTANIAPPARIITPEALVRLLSVPPAQAQNIAKEFVSALPNPATNIIDKAVFRAVVIAQNAVSQTTQAPLLQAPTTTTTQPNQIIQNQTQPILNNNFIAQAQPPLQTSLQQTTILQPAILNTAQALTPSQVSPPSLATAIIAPQITTAIATPQTTIQSATLVPVTFDPNNPTQTNTQRLGQIDINIIKITPPNAVLTTPQAISSLPPPSPIPAATQFAPPVIGANTAISLSAQVTGFTAQGLPLITIQGLNGGLPQSFILQQTSSNLQLGSQLQIIPKNGVPIAGQLSPVATQTLNNPLLRGFQWPVLDDLYNTLLKISPQAAASLTRSLPNAGNPAQMSAAAMTFIAAVKSGNFDQLLGDKKIDLLQQIGRRSILSGLTQDVSARAPEAASSSEWRAVPMPMFWESEIHKITLYTRNENQDEQKEQNGNNQTRFIFDLNLTRMGDVQIDGLIKDKRLDLVIRTNNSFSEPMQQTMRQAYSGALEQAELSGELNFQGSTKNWVHVLRNQEQLGMDI